MTDTQRDLDGIRLITRKQLAQMTGIGLHTLKMMEYAGDSPPPVRFGSTNNSRVYYRLKDAEAWIKRHMKSGEAA